MGLNFSELTIPMHPGKKGATIINIKLCTGQVTSWK